MARYCESCGTLLEAGPPVEEVATLLPTGEERSEAGEGSDEVALAAVEALEHVATEALETIGDMQREEEQTERVEAEADAIEAVAEAIVESEPASDPPAEEATEAPAEPVEEAEEEAGDEGDAGEPTAVEVPPQIRDEPKAGKKKKQTVSAFRAHRR